MKKTVLILFAALVAAGALVLLVGRTGVQRIRIVQTGDAAPEFRLAALDGRFVDLASLRGKVVLVHFWATWCPPCVEEIPTLEQLYRSYADKDVVLLAVSVDDGPGIVQEFLRQKRLTLPVLMDPGKAVAASYGTLKFPETYVLDRGGVVRNKIIGAADWARPEARAIIDALLAQR